MQYVFNYKYVLIYMNYIKETVSYNQYRICFGCGHSTDSTLSQNLIMKVCVRNRFVLILLPN